MKKEGEIKKKQRIKLKRKELASERPNGRGGAALRTGGLR